MAVNKYGSHSYVGDCHESLLRSSATVLTMTARYWFKASLRGTKQSRFFFFKSYFLLPIFLFSYQFAHSQNSSCKIDSIIDFSFKYMGTPYEWGETGPYSFDCSGFIQFIFSKNDLHIKRTSRLQNQDGEDVLLKDIKRGDLVFFFSGDFPERDIGHVGMAISDYSNRNFKFIHSSSSLNGVYVSEFKERMFQKSFAGAKRILQCEETLSKNSVLIAKERNVQAVDSLNFDDVEITTDEKTGNTNAYRLIYHTLKKGETLLTISRYYHVPVANIKRWNNLKSDSLIGVRRLKIYVWIKPE
jgi:hypothetical protein